MCIASLNGHLDVARLLLDRGAEVGQAGNNGWSPLCIASVMPWSFIFFQNGANIGSPSERRRPSRPSTDEGRMFTTRTSRSIIQSSWSSA